MECTDVIFTRHSVRSFMTEPIPDEVLNSILQAGRLSPSTQNRQCWRFIVVRNPEIKKQLAFHSLLGTVNYFIKEAPVVIVACADPDKSLILNEQAYYLVDTAIAFQQMMLMAWNFGVGSCWLGAFDEKKVKTLLGIPDAIRIVGMSPFGYPREKKSFYAKAVSFYAKSNHRLPLEKTVYYDVWKNKMMNDDEIRPEGD